MMPVQNVPQFGNQVHPSELIMAQAMQPVMYAMMLPMQTGTSMQMGNNFMGTPQQMTQMPQMWMPEASLQKATVKVSQVQGRQQMSSAGHVLAPHGFSSERLKELKNDLESGLAEREVAAIEAVTGRVWPLSKDAVGCRVVQLAIEKAHMSMAKALASELRSHIKEACANAHGNYVVQKVLTQLSSSFSSFVAEELAGSGARFARHQFGCRILCRLLEHCSTEEATQQLVKEILADEPLKLCQHNFGHHVAKSILEHGDDEHREFIANVLQSEVVENAKHRNASFVVEAALNYCSEEDQSSLRAELLFPEVVADLEQSRFGHFVARTLLER